MLTSSNGKSALQERIGIQSIGTASKLESVLRASLFSSSLGEHGKGSYLGRLFPDSDISRYLVQRRCEFESNNNTRVPVIVRINAQKPVLSSPSPGRVHSIVLIL
jgi:hypothetical protein